MKFQVTARQMKDSYNNVIAIGYCNAQHLLAYEQAFAYSSGAMGWNCDYYYSPLDSTIISTGYRPIGEHPDYDLVREYDVKAEKLQATKRFRALSLKTKQRHMQKLIEEFVLTVINKEE